MINKSILNVVFSPAIAIITPNLYRKDDAIYNITPYINNEIEWDEDEEDGASDEYHLFLEVVCFHF